MKTFCMLALAALSAGAWAQQTEKKDYVAEAVKLEKKNADASEPAPWLNNYPMSFFTKTRSARTVGKGRTEVSLLVQYIDSDQKFIGNEYHSMPAGDSRYQTSMVVCTKYGWARDHHIAVGVPILFNDFDLKGVTNHSRGVGNVYIGNQWNIIKETETFPAVAVDFYYYFPSGDPDRKLGTDDGAYKVTTEVSKAWKDFSLHFNPGYVWSETPDNNWSEINAGVYFTMHPKLWPAIEYNYLYKENYGHCHDLVPGILWKLPKRTSFKIGFPISLDSTTVYRDRVGVLVKFSKTF